MDKKPITQKDIAQHLGLDHSTVSLALRNSKKISEAKRELILKTAAEMGYRVNAAAANLAKHRSTSSEAPVKASLAWLNCWSNPKELLQYREFQLYWEGARETASRLGYSLEEFIVEKEMTLERVKRIMLARGIKGILLPPHPRRDTFKGIDWNQFSVLRFGRSIQYPLAHMISADQVGNMICAYHEALKRGYRRIGMAGRPMEEHWNNFDAGYLKAQDLNAEKNRIPIFSMLEKNPLSQLAQFKEWLEAWQIDAIISATGGVSTMLKAANYEIGTDIGLATMSVLDTSIDAGIYQNSDEIGRVAALSLISQIQDNDTGVPKLFRKTLVQGAWVDGKSLPDRSRSL
ncbi:MAG: LacI family transcriptional regulator [Opitutales bacterium]|jgi:LacI family transcriptional regulator|nr:LacI family transcriptional regulator [Opitutales bacterium]